MSVNLKKTGKLSSNDSAILFLMVLYLLGALIGTFLYCSPDIVSIENLSKFSGSLIDSRLGQTFLQTLVNSFSGAFLLLLCCFILGFGAIFQPVEIIIPIFRGLGMGVSLAGMYSQFGISGFGISLILIIPNGIISAIVLIIGVREAIRMSNSIGMVVFSQKSGFEPVDYRLYFTKFVILSAILVVSSLADSLLTFLFAGFWIGLLGI